MIEAVVWKWGGTSTLESTPQVRHSTTLFSAKLLKCISYLKPALHSRISPRNLSFHDIHMGLVPQMSLHQGSATFGIVKKGIKIDRSKVVLRGRLHFEQPVFFTENIQLWDLILISGLVLHLTITGAQLVPCPFLLTDFTHTLTYTSKA